MELPIVNHPDYVAKINDDNKFPIKKFGALASHLLKNKVVKKFYIPKECSIKTLRTSHSIKYINDIRNKTLDKEAQKKIGFPINDSVVRRSFVATGGTVLASKLALEFKLACNTAGGSHHATFDFGAGYCVFNDTAVAANYLRNKGYVKKILILDLDVHQGNGNSEIFKNDKDVLTFSMHCASNYPAKKSKSDIDINLRDGMEDDEYLEILNKNLKELNKNNFDFVFYVAGVDIHFEDRLGKLKISDEGVNKRDQIVIENFYSKNIPLCGVLGGGYNKSFEKLIELHSMLHKNCANYLS
ncbi:MAG: histone deacetylase [Pseudomonadota bacterium]|nr:histone deacetylase [Pseudomonadota bacterium]